MKTDTINLLKRKELKELISYKTHRALKILADNKRITAADFAVKMWGESHIMHKKVLNTGNGATAGKAAWLCAGSYIGRLKKMGLVSNFSLEGYELTDAGKVALKAYEENPRIKIIRSIKNSTGGFIHIDVTGKEHFDLYCEGAHLYEFLNKKPY